MSSLSTYDLLAAVSFVFCISAFVYFWDRSSNLSLPPGPKGLPLIGNLLQYPKADEHKTFKKWGDEYGEICCATVMGKTIIILNSVGAMNELLEKRASIYSGRPKLWMAGELCEFDRTVTLTHDKELHKKQRQMFSMALSNRAARGFEPMQLTESRKMMLRVAETPERLENHVVRTVVSVILMASHGYQVDSDEDQYIELGKRALGYFSQATQPGAYLVEFFPFLRFLPDWFPGTSFLRDAKVWRKAWYQLAEQPFYWVKANMAAGTAIPSFTSILLEKANGDKEEEEVIKWTAGTMYGGGSDTSASAIMTFFLAMMIYPKVQSKAQAEIDSVIGHDRLPTFADKDNMPYCTAIVKECLRWKPVLPTGIVRCAREGDTYHGYRIPKDALVIGNIWSTTRTADIYPDPEEFIPERFLAEDGKSPRTPEGMRDIGSFAFGFGRRICPGAATAEATLFIAVANALWTFNVKKVTGTDGKPIEPDLEYLNGVISHPKPFVCDIRPRSEQSVKMLRQSLETV